MDVHSAPLLQAAAPAPLPIRLLGRTVDWAVITIGCDKAAEYAPTSTPCRCVEGVCRGP